MPRVFINFRKADERWMRDRLYQALISRFAASEFFKSGESIPPGSGFARILLAQAKSCEVMLVLIGSRWLNARDKKGRRLIDRDGDWVRREIATSISAGNLVVPVLLGDTTMLPEPSQLPPDIAKIGKSQFRRVPKTHLTAELDDFVDWVARLLPDLRAATAPASEPSGTPVPAGSQRASTSPTFHQEVGMIKIHDITGGNVAVGTGDVIVNPPRSPLDTMRDELSHHDVVKRIEAASSLSDDQYREAVHDLIRRLWQEDHGEAQYWLIEALGNAGGDDAVRALTAFAKTEAAQNPLLQSRIDKALRTARKGGLRLAAAGRRGGPR